MTECNQKFIGFPSCKRRKVEANFAGGDVTSDGGALLLRQVDRHLGLTTENLERAPKLYGSTLRVYSEETYPSEFAMVQNSLGDVYMSRIHGDRSENLQQAIGCYEHALRVNGAARSKDDRAWTLNNLAAAHYYRDIIKSCG